MCLPESQGYVRDIMDFIMHSLNFNPNCPQVKQKRRTFNQERNKAIQMEVEKLLKAGFFREVLYPNWISNVVLVKKANKQRWMCVDFTDFNRACPKNSFRLSRID